MLTAFDEAVVQYAAELGVESELVYKWCDVLLPKGRYFYTEEELLSSISKLKAMRCSICGIGLSKNNCTHIRGTCDDCLANQAAEDRVYEWENGIGFE